jgi:hypothetical protein
VQEGGRRARSLLELQNLLDSQIAATGGRDHAGKRALTTRRGEGQNGGDRSSSSSSTVEKEGDQGRHDDEQAALVKRYDESEQEDAGAEETNRLRRRQRLLRESGALTSPSTWSAGTINGSVGAPDLESDKERDKRTLFVGNLPAGPPLERIRKTLLKLVKPFGAVDTMRFRSFAVDTEAKVVLHPHSPALLPTACVACVCVHVRVRVRVRVRVCECVVRVRAYERAGGGRADGQAASPRDM